MSPYSFEIKQRDAPPSSASSATNGTPKHVVLTGSTGTLGAYLLNELLTDPTVDKISCFNRSSNAFTKQQINHASRGLETNFPSSRVEFLRCNLAVVDLGLKPIEYQSLLHSVTHIIHSAWPVDFNRHFSTFEPQIQGIRNLIEFVHACAPRSPRLFFLSSASAAGRWGAMPGALAKVPEVVLEDWRLAKMGYGQSKLVAERLIAEAAVQYGIDAAICRLTHVSGPVLRGTQGEWNPAEWLPRLMLSSKNMKLIPCDLGPMEIIDWIPVDLAARICTELLFVEQNQNRRASREGRRLNSAQGDNTTVTGSKRASENKVRVWHVANPRTTTWSAILPSVMQRIDKCMTSATFVHWVEELERRSVQQQGRAKKDMIDLPAAKLLSFFEDLRDRAVRFPQTSSATLETKETIKCSPTMARVPAVNAGWLGLWISQWRL